MATNVGNTVVQIPTTPGTTTLEQKRTDRLRKLAISQLVLGSIYGVLCIVELFSFRYYSEIGPLLVVQLLAPIFVLVAGSLIVCCNCRGCCMTKCKLRGHFVLAIIASVFLLLFAFDDLSVIALELEYTDYYHFCYKLFAIPLSATILAFINFGLMLWSAIISAKLAFRCCRGEPASWANEPQVIYVNQQRTAGNPQLAMMQPAQSGIMPQPSFNGMVMMQQPAPTTMVQPSQFRVVMQPAQVVMQPATTSTSPAMNSQESSNPVEEVEPETDESASPEVKSHKYKPLQLDENSEPEMTLTSDSDTQLLIPE